MQQKFERTIAHKDLTGYLLSEWDYQNWNIICYTLGNGERKKKGRKAPLPCKGFCSSLQHAFFHVTFQVVACLFLWAWGQPVKSPLRSYTGAQIQNKSVTPLVNLFVRTEQSTWLTLLLTIECTQPMFDNYMFAKTSTQDSWGVRTFKLCVHTPFCALPELQSLWVQRQPGKSSRRATR